MNVEVSRKVSYYLMYCGCGPNNCRIYYIDVLWWSVVVVAEFAVFFITEQVHVSYVVNYTNESACLSTCNLGINI